MRYTIGVLAISILAACSAPDQFIASPRLVADDRIPSKFASIEIVRVSLPSYAEREEISVMEDGVLVLSETQWVDEPSRAMTLALSRHLSEITEARVASEPWPFDGFAESRVEVRVEELIIRDNALRLAGEYHVVDLERRNRDHAHLFALSAPMAAPTPASVAAARARLVLDLAELIARDGL